MISQTSSKLLGEFPPPSVSGGWLLAELRDLKIDDGIGAGELANCRMSFMNLNSTIRVGVAAFVLILGAVPFASSDDLTGTRPGFPDQTLTIQGTLFLLDVSKIDGADGSFTADVFLMLSWKDERLASGEKGVRRKPLSSIWSPQVQVLNQRRIWKTFPDTADISTDGTVVHRQRYFGRFAAPLDLRDFPIDRQQLEIQVVIP